MGVNQILNRDFMLSVQQKLDFLGLEKTYSNLK